MQLPLTTGERKILRDAGLAPPDLAHMSADALVMATDEAIEDGRASELVALASLQTLAPVTAGVARVLFGLGVRDAADLASRTADELYVDVARRLGGDHPSWHDICSAAIDAANGGIDVDPRWWQRRRTASGFEPVELRWRDIHGDASPPQPIENAWVEVPSVRIRARLVSASLDEQGAVVSPLRSKDVSLFRDVLVGHRVWSGGHGAFLELPKVSAGDSVELRVGSDVRQLVVDQTTRLVDGIVLWSELLATASLTLVTGAPVPAQLDRFVVRAR